MKLVRTFAFSVSVAAASMLAVACGGSVEEPHTTASAATKAPIATHERGVVKLVGDALGEVPLRAEQRSEIDKLVADAEARHAPLAAGRKELLTAFADQIEKGTIDKAALQPRIDKLTADFQAIQGSDRAAIVKLHDLLDANQRNAFVDAFEAQMKAKRGEFAAGGFGKLKELSDELKLTDAQKTQLRDAMHAAHDQDGGGHGWKRAGEGGGRGWGRHGGRRPLEAFREDKLDLDKALPAADAKAHAGFFAERAASFAEKALPILTPEQRKIAADKLRAIAAQGDDSLLVH